MDLALYTVDWDPEEVQLLALASLQLAAKMEEDTPPGPALFLPLAGDIYTKEDLARIEMELLQVGNFPLPFSIPVIMPFYEALSTPPSPLIIICISFNHSFLYRERFWKAPKYF